MFELHMNNCPRGKKKKKKVLRESWWMRPRFSPQDGAVTIYFAFG